MKLLKKIDIHVHSTPRRFTPPISKGAVSYAEPHELREIYNLYNIEKGVFLPSGTYAACTEDVISMREAHDLVKSNSETLGWWFCNVNPAWGKNTPDCDLSHFILFYKEMGAKGVGEITENRPFDDPYMMNLLKHCEACEMPIIFHLGNCGNDYGIVDSFGLPGLEFALKTFPKLKFIGHSQKFWAEMSGDLTPEQRGGYPKGKVVPGGRVPELMKKYPNLYCDLSAGSGSNAIMRDAEFGYKFLEEFSDRTFFGTDICSPKNITDPMLKLSGYLDEAVQNGCISYDTYAKISRGNALKLLGEEDKSL